MVCMPRKSICPWKSRVPRSEPSNHDTGHSLRPHQRSSDKGRGGYPDQLRLRGTFICVTWVPSGQAGFGSRCESLQRQKIPHGYPPSGHS